MEIMEFWRIVDAAKAESDGSVERRYDALLSRLMGLPASEIIDFELIKNQRVREADRWDLWAAAYIINDGCSDDDFQDFRRWLISRGERAYYASIADPESLVEWVKGESCIFFEALGWVASEAYKMAVGRSLREDMPRLPLKSKSEPAGVRWHSDRELAVRLPRLYATFRQCDG